MGDRRSSAEVIAAFDLAPHAEGGYFRETYRSSVTVDTDGGARASATAILYLVTERDPSRFHRLTGDEMWFFHAGGPLEMVFLEERGAPARVVTLSGPEPQLLAPAGVWMAARVTPGHLWTLAGCVVTPGFEYDDFEKAERQTLLHDYPEAAALIAALT